MKRRLSNKLIKGEKGQALLLAMVMMLFGSIIIPPMLSHMRTGLGAEREVYEERMYLTYAADSGVQDGLWQVKNKNLPNLFTNYDQYAYYDYSHSNEWQYNLYDQYDETGIVNGKDVNVTFQNVWMPKGISAPSPSDATNIANYGRLAVYGSMSGVSATEYQIKILYYYNSTNPAQPDYDPQGANLRVQSLGIWLPPGFDYNDSLAGAPTGFTPSVEDSSYKGGRAVVWNFPSSPSYPTLSSFTVAGSSTNPMVRTITFQFTGPESRAPGSALSWITSTGVSGISYSWDSSVKVYKITSEASDETDKIVTVDAYAATTEMLKRGAAICGDYVAIGSTLMKTTSDSYYRDVLFKNSYATVQSTDEEAPFYIPVNAHVDLAYLYWSGWLENAVIWSDDCGSLSNWNYSSSNWSVSSSRFRGHYSGSGSRELAMKSNINLSPYVGQTVNVSWAQSKGGTLGSGDGLDFAFSKDGGVTWSASLNPPNGAFRGNNPSPTFTYPIPPLYLTDQFRMKFSLVGCSGSGGGHGGGGTQYVYIDDIRISVGTPVENAKANQVMFNGIKVTANPATGGIQTQESSAIGAEGSLSYSCFCDVTALVLGMIEDEELGPSGSGTYTVGHVLDWPGSYKMYNYPDGTLSGDTTAYPLGTPAQKTGSPLQFPMKYQWSYAAWSLVIVYSSPDTQGHQLYLYPDLRYCDSNETLNFDIGGFIAPEAIKDEDHAARLTCFVGEGDLNYSGDYIEVTGEGGTTTRLWDGTTTSGNSQTSPNNVWNSNSVGVGVQSGIDIDTFTVTYPTITPGAVLAHVRIDTQSDTWNLIYMILSFRSEIVPASTVSYLVR